MSYTVSSDPVDRTEETQPLLAPADRPVTADTKRSADDGSECDLPLGFPVTVPGTETTLPGTEVTWESPPYDGGKSERTASIQSNSAGSYTVLSKGTDFTSLSAPPGQNTCSVAYLDKDALVNEIFAISIGNKGQPENEVEGKIKWRLYGLVEVTLEVYRFVSRAKEEFENLPQLKNSYTWSWSIASKEDGWELLANPTKSYKEKEDEAPPWSVMKFWLDKGDSSVKYWAADGVDAKVTYMMKNDSSLREAKKAGRLGILGRNWRLKAGQAVTGFQAAVRSLS